MRSCQLDNIQRLRIVRRLSYASIATVIGCSREYLSMIFRGKRNPSVLLAKKLVEFFDIELINFIDRIYPRCSPSGSYVLSSSFPLQVSPEIASLLGHSFGDGHVGVAFSYTNTDEGLVLDVEKCVESLPIHNLTKNDWYHHGHTVRFSTLVRDILLAFGAPQGNKIQQKTFVPFWIKNGSDEIKRGFLQALFDDEGIVTLEKRTISFVLAKILAFDSSLRFFFDDIRTLLTDLGIINPRITSSFYSSQGQRKIILQISVYGYYNFLEFQEKVNFIHQQKRLLLDYMIKQTHHIKLNKEDRDQWFEGLLDCHPHLTALDLSKIMGMSHKGVMNYLLGMERRNLVKRTKRFYTSGSKWSLFNEEVPHEGIHIC